MSEKTPLPPPSEPFPGSRTPGWNDPPTMQYSNIGNNTARTRLNKRVAFPLQGTVAGDANITAKPTAVVPPQAATMAMPPLPPPSSTQQIAVVHPMPMNIPPASVPTPPPSLATSTESAEVNLPGDERECAMRTFWEYVATMPESSANVRREEIERRLSIIDQLWQTGNLSTTLQEQIYRLAEAMKERNYNSAIEIYTVLVANHSHECATWAIALRHLVLTLQPITVDTASAAAATTSDSITSDVGNTLPAMLVPAVPRQPTENIPAARVQSTSTIQHI